MKCRLVFIISLMLIIPVFNGLIVAGPITGKVTSFNDSEISKEVELGQSQAGSLVGSIEIPNRAVITDASFNITTIANSNYEYPAEIYVDVGNDDKYEWGFDGIGHGQFGQQKYFLDGKTDTKLKFVGNDFNTSARFRMPKDATVTSTMMLIDGRSNVSGADPTKSWTALQNYQSTKVVANITGGKVYFARYNQRYFDIYNPKTNSWSQSASCTDDIADPSHGIAVVGPEIYVTTETWIFPTWTYKLFSYNTQTNTWTFRSNLPAAAPSIAFGGLTYDQKDNLYAIEDLWNSPKFYNYSISENKWTKLKSPSSISVNYPTLCYLDNKVYMAEYTWSSSSTQFSFYAPNNDTWFTLPNAPSGFISRLCTDGYNIFAAEDTGHIMKYDVPTNTWAETQPQGSLSLSGITGFAYSDRVFYLSSYTPSGRYYSIPGLPGGDFPVNASLDIGDNGGLPEWNITGEFNTTDYVNDFSSELNNILSTSSTTYVDDYGNNFVDVIINVTSEVTSEFAIRKMFVNYTHTETVDLNPFTGNLVNALNELVPDTGEGNITIPIVAYSSLIGKVNISNISIDYYIPDLTNDRFELINGHGADGKILYADYKNYTFLVNITNRAGPTDVDNVTIFLDVPGENLQIIWYEQNDSFYELFDPQNLITLDTTNSNSSNNSVDHWTLNFTLRFDWAYPNDDLELCAIRTINDTGAWKFNEFEDVYVVENDLDLIGNLDVIAQRQGKLIEDDTNNWVHASELITWGNLTVVYNGTTDIYPDNKNFNITIIDDDNGVWVNSSSSGKTFSITTVSDPGSDYFDLHYINITDIPGLGKDVSNWDFMIKTDDDGPGTPPNIVCRADSQVDQETTADDDATIYVVWGAATDGTGSGVVEYAMEFNNPLPTEIKKSSDTATGIEGVATFYVRARDKVGNWGSVGNDDIIIDLTDLNYGDATPAADIWQNNQTVFCTISVQDLGGSGVNVDEVQYRKVDEGNITEGSWNQYKGPGVSGETLLCQQNITFAYDGTDKKVQWRAKDVAGNGWIFSDTYQLKIDSIPTTIDLKEPSLNNWLDTKSPYFKFYINDTGGSGVDISSLSYAISTTGPDSFGSWQNLACIGTGESVYCGFSPTFAEGDQNFLIIRAADLAGNIITFSPMNVLIDLSAPEFSNPLPSLSAWATKTTITCSITIHEPISSIDLSSVRYQYSSNGTAHYSNWKLTQDFEALDDGYTFTFSCVGKFADGTNNYIRWSAADLAGHKGISNDYLIQVDIRPIQFGEAILNPTIDQWSNTNTVPCSISINDTLGSGVLASSIEYSISTSGVNEFKQWLRSGLEIIDLASSTPSNDDTLVSDFILATVTPQFAEGTDNYIRWHGTDFAGNTIVVSDPQQINIDLQGLVFTDPIPKENQIVDDLEQVCQIRILDIGGSGVDTSSVEYRYSNSGKDEFSDWTNEDLNIKDKNTFFVYLPFNKGAANHIMWRSYDLAGNGPIESRTYNITINSGPTAEIDQPAKNQQFKSNEQIYFDAGSSFDPDYSDELQYQWISNVSMIFGTEESFSYQLPAGVHNITLIIEDGHGHTSTANTEIRVIKYIAPPSDDNDTSDDIIPVEDDKEEPKKKGKSSDYTIVFVLLIMLIIVLILVRFAVRIRRKQIKDELAKAEETESKITTGMKASTGPTPPMIPPPALGPSGAPSMPMLPPPMPPMFPGGQIPPPHMPPPMTAQHMVQLPGHARSMTPIQSYTPRPTKPPAPDLKYKRPKKKSS